MSYKVVVSQKFDKELKRLVSKFPSLQGEYAMLIDSLENEPLQGIPIGRNCFKIRMPLHPKAKAGSKGNHLCAYSRQGCLLSIFDKSEEIAYQTSQKR